MSNHHLVIRAMAGLIRVEHMVKHHGVHSLCTAIPAFRKGESHTFRSAFILEGGIARVVFFTAGHTFIGCMAPAAPSSAPALGKDGD